jgi:putative transposase
VLSRHVGAARFAFNQALRLHRDAHTALDRVKNSPRGQALPLTDGPSSSAASDGGVVATSGGSLDGPRVPWTGFDLINAFNAWKQSQAAGRHFVVGPDLAAEVVVTGLVWRHQVVAQVFEESAVDLGRALKAWNDSRTGIRKGARVGVPRFRRRTPLVGHFGFETRPTGADRAFASVTATAPGRCRCRRSVCCGYARTRAGSAGCLPRVELGSCP